MFFINWIIPQRALIWVLAFLPIVFHSTPFCHVCPHALILNNYSLHQFAYYRSQTASLLFSFWLNLAFEKLTFQRTVRVAIKIDLPEFPLNEPALLLLTVWGNCISRGKSDIMFNLPDIYSASLRCTAWFNRLKLICTWKEAKKESSNTQSKSTGILEMYSRCPKVPVSVIPSGSHMYSKDFPGTNDILSRIWCPLCTGEDSLAKIPPSSGCKEKEEK